MKRNAIRKNMLTLALMASSIVLLLVLQFFWLRSVYVDAQADFQKETTMILRNTISAMHDTLIFRSIVPTEGTAAEFHPLPSFFSRRDSIRIESVPDSMIREIRVKQNNTTIEIVGQSGNPDSLKRILRPLAARIVADHNPKSFIIRMTADTLSVDSIAIKYRDALSDVGIRSPFEIHLLKGGREKRKEKMTALLRSQIVSEPIPFSPMNGYAATFPGVQMEVLKEVAPAALFSLVLTLLTSIAFFVVYRNLRSQQKLMAIKNDFISNVTHELKTPVATVSVALEALKSFHALDDPARTAEYLDIAQRELNRLTLMTDKILKTSVFEDQGVDMKMALVDLDELSQQVLESMKLVFEKRQTTLRYSKEGTDFNVEGAAQHLTNVLYNLLDNALKYGGTGAAVAVHLTAAPTAVTVAVSDNGPGIEPEYQKKIFEKFFRVPSGDIHNVKGYGLGLNYVASVVKGHHGKLWVESEVGKGSRFVIVLPRKQNDED